MSSYSFDKNFLIRIRILYFWMFQFRRYEITVGLKLLETTTGNFIVHKNFHFALYLQNTPFIH